MARPMGGHSTIVVLASLIGTYVTIYNTDQICSKLNRMHSILYALKKFKFFKIELFKALSVQQISCTKVGGISRELWAPGPENGKKHVPKVPKTRAKSARDTPP